MGCPGCREKTIPEKLSSIYNGWKHLIWTSAEIEKIAKERAVICSECSHNKNGICRQCYCVISAKIRSKIEKCPVAKW